jgi:glucokinase
MLPTLDPAPTLVADIGGTNARFGLLRPGSRAVEAVRSLCCKDYPGPVQAIEDYLAGVSGPRPACIGIAIANPVTGDRIRMTNHHWTFSIEEARRALRAARLEVYNDFFALAAAVPLLGGGDLRQVGRGSAAAGTPMAVLGPGTGLGVSGLVPTQSGWQPIAGEGGHVTYSPADEFEAQIVGLLRRRHPHVSAERLISGPGLSLLHGAIGEVRGTPGPACEASEITARALAGGDALCAETLATFCAMLGTVAGNLALTLGARGGVHIGGGIVPRLGAAFDQSRFRERFESKGRFAEYLAEIPTFVIVAQTPALIGAAHLIGAIGD